MRAGHLVLGEILESLGEGDDNGLLGLAKRYGDDKELKEIVRHYTGSGDIQAAQKRLSKLRDVRKLASGGTRLHGKDRRRPKEGKGFEDH